MLINTTPVHAPVRLNHDDEELDIVTKKTLYKMRQFYMEKSGTTNDDSKYISKFRAKIIKKIGKRFAWKIHPTGYYIKSYEDPLTFAFETIIHPDMATLEDMETVAYYISLSIRSAFHDAGRDFTYQIKLLDQYNKLPAYIIEFIPYGRI